MRGDKREEGRQAGRQADIEGNFLTHIRWSVRLATRRLLAAVPSGIPAVATGDIGGRKEGRKSSHLSGQKLAGGRAGAGSRSEPRVRRARVPYFGSFGFGRHGGTRLTSDYLRCILHSDAGKPLVGSLVRRAMLLPQVRNSRPTGMGTQKMRRTERRPIHASNLPGGGGGARGTRRFDRGPKLR